MRPIPPNRERPRKHPTPQSPQLSSLLKKKASTILPHTPLPLVNRLPSSQPIIHTSIPPSQETLWHLPPPPPSPPPTSYLTTSLPPFPLPISHLTTLHQPFPPSSTISSPLTRYHSHNLGVATLLLISSPTPLSLPSGNLSHWTVIQARQIQTITSKYISLMSPSTLLMMPFSARPFLPPSKAPPSNGLPPYHHTPSIALTPSRTCSLLTSLAVAHIKPQLSLFLASDRNKRRRFRPLSTASIRLPSAHHTLTKR